MKSNILNTFDYNLFYARKLIDDVSEKLWAAQPGGVPNHAAWVIGHLAVTTDFAASQLGLPGTCPKEWQGLFGNGSIPVADASKYPNKATLLKALEDGHTRVAAAFAKVDEKSLTAANPSSSEGFRKRFPTAGDVLVFLLTSHEMTHLGQLSAWRRAAGLKSVY